MKKFILYIGIIILIASCEDMEDRNYDAGPEKFYPPRVINTQGIPGYKKAKVTWDFSANNINTAEKIYIKITAPTIGFSKEVTIDGLVNSYLEEGLESDVNYVFTVQTMDSEGNLSIINPTGGQTANIYVYGDSFGADLKPRTVNSMVIQGNSISIELGSSALLYGTSEFKYYSKSTGEEVTIVTNQEDDNVVLEDVDVTKLVKYRTSYVPTEPFLDEFYSEWGELAVPAVISDIANSISYKAILGGVNIKWSNPTGESISVVVKYMKNGVETSSKFSSSNIEGSQDVIGLENGTQNITIIVSDLVNNGISKSFTINVQEAVSLNKSAWSIVEASLTRPDYPVTNVIDGDVSTFWHTPSSESNSPTGIVPGYPHYFIVDLGSIKTVSSYKLFRRLNNTTGANVHEIWVSSDNVTFTKVATYNSQIPDNNGVMLAADAQDVRYVKYNAVSGPQLYTNLGEIEVYGLE